jgi:serine/threonine protein kinase
MMSHSAGDLSGSLVGQTLAGRYRALRVVGRGGMGVVYEAEQIDLRRRVAVKVVDDADPRIVDRFRQEALATANLNCPNVVTVLDFCFSPDQPPMLVMELLDGESLFHVLRRDGPLPLPRAVGIAAQMLNGLAAAHRAGIVHRDVKPSNVFILRTSVGDDVVKLLDFGIAKVLSGGIQTTTGALSGTPAYVAPEQLRLQPVDARTDLHAVGVCLFEMVAGKTPWRSWGGPLLSAEILREEPISLAEVCPEAPAPLGAVIARALAKDPAARYPDATAMLAALRPWIVNASDPSVPIAQRHAPAVDMPATRRADVPPPAPPIPNAPAPPIPNLPLAPSPNLPPAPAPSARPLLVAIFAVVFVAVLAIGLVIGGLVVKRHRSPEGGATASPLGR